MLHDDYCGLMDPSRTRAVLSVCKTKNGVDPLKRDQHGMRSASTANGSGMSVEPRLTPFLERRHGFVDGEEDMVGADRVEEASSASGFEHRPPDLRERKIDAPRAQGRLRADRGSRSW